MTQGPARPPQKLRWLRAFSRRLQPECADVGDVLKWSAEFETGITVIDEDHKKVVGGLNELEQSMNAGSGSERVVQLLDFLEDYARNHFAREERCMEHFRCPTAQANKDAHAEFIAKFEAARQRLRASDGAAALVAMQVHRDLCDWIVSHILRVDSALKVCVPSHRAQRPGAS